MKIFLVKHSNILKNMEEKMRKATLVLIATTLMASGCSWVSLTPEGETVKVAKRNEVANCQKLGTTTSNGVSRVGILSRDEKVIFEELSTLARNEAASLGGNTVVPDSEISIDGRQRFAIYQCPY